MQRNEQKYDWMEGNKHSSNKIAKTLKPGFLRKPYQYTKAEIKGATHKKGKGAEER